jgi:hypothetical protein
MLLRGGEGFSTAERSKHFFQEIRYIKNGSAFLRNFFFRHSAKQPTTRSNAKTFVSFSGRRRSDVELVAEHRSNRRAICASALTSQKKRHDNNVSGRAFEGFRVLPPTARDKHFFCRGPIQTQTRTRSRITISPALLRKSIECDGGASAAPHITNFSPPT